MTLPLRRGIGWVSITGGGVGVSLFFGGEPEGGFWLCRFLVSRVIDALVRAVSITASRFNLLGARVVVLVFIGNDEDLVRVCTVGFDMLTELDERVLALFGFVSTRCCGGVMFAVLVARFRVFVEEAGGGTIVFPFCFFTVLVALLTRLRGGVIAGAIDGDFRVRAGCFRVVAEGVGVVGVFPLTSL
jgi:hypothetical protein